MTKSLACAIAVLLLTSTAALARCPTLTGFAAFQRCYLEADSAMELNTLRTLYETMLAEDRANARAWQYQHSLEALGAAGPLERRSRSELERQQHSLTPPEHRDIEVEMQRQQILRQQRSFDAGRARNQFRVDQGRVRSQDFFSGKGNF